MTRVATSWLVYRLTGSAMLLGTVSFLGQISVFLLAPFAGVLIDRMDRRRVMVVTQVLAMLQSLALAVLTLLHRINMPEVMALSALQGTINAFDMPARQSFMVQMVDGKKDLPNAIAINSSMVNLARLIGPAVAGLLIAATNEGWCFLADGVSYVPVIVSLLMMRVAPRTQAKATTSMLTQLREGWAYVIGDPPIRIILTLFVVISIMGWAFMPLMPLIAGEVLHGGPHTYGFLLGAVGVGSLYSTLRLVLRRNVRGLTRVIPTGAFMLGVGLIGLGLSPHLWISMQLVLLIGCGMMLALTSSNTIIQTIVSEEMRGRVMSYYTLALVGMTPFGALLAGVMAKRIGAPKTIIVDGIACVLGALWFVSQRTTLRTHLAPRLEESAPS
jgi:MFS family permease